MRMAPVLFFSCLFACGGGGAKPVVIPALGDGGAAGDAGASLSTTPPPSGLPPMAEMPPPGVRGSKKATIRTDGALFTCGGGSSPAAKDPLRKIEEVGRACAAASKTKPLGAPFRGQQRDQDPHAEHKFHVDANKCYRVYFATSESIKAGVAIVRDSAGDVVATSSGDAAVPHDGLMCFTSADDVTLMIGIGSGTGSYAAQVWGQ